MCKRRLKGSWGRASRMTRMAACLLMLFLGMQSVSAFEFEGYTYTVKSDGTASLTSGGKSTNPTVIVPDWAYDGNNCYAVTEVAASAFKDVSTITKVVIGDNVTTIGNKAFEHFGEHGDGLVLVLGKSVNNLDDKAFEHFGEHGSGHVVILKSGIPAANANALEHVQSATFYVKDRDAYNNHTSATGWKNFNGKKGNQYTYPFPAELSIKGGQWKTAMLPEAMDAERVASVFGNGTQVALLNSLSGTEDKGYIAFFKKQNDIPANEPILIKVGNNEAYYVSNVEYSGQSDDTHVLTARSDDGTVVSMTGACADYTLQAGEIYFRNDNGAMKFFRAADDKSCHVRKGQCWFALAASQAGEAKAESLGLGIEDGATGMREIIQAPQSISTHIYSLTGMDEGTDLKALPRGIYVVNGRKVLVK